MHTLENVFESASENALQHLLYFLEEEKTANFIINEVKKIGGFQNPQLIAEMAEFIIDELRHKLAADATEQHDAFSLFEWLDYWFGEASAKSPFVSNGVFFKRGDAFLKSLEDYAKSFKNIQVIPAQDKLNEVRADVEAFNKAIEAKDRPTIQQFLDKHIPGYTIKEGPEGTLPTLVAPKGVVDKGLLEHSRKNKQILNTFNTKVSESNKNLVEDYKKYVAERIESLRDEIESTPVPYDPDLLKESKQYVEDPPEDADSNIYFETPFTSPEGEEKTKTYKRPHDPSRGKDVPSPEIIGLQQLVIIREQNAKFYEELLTNKLQLVQQYTEDLPAVKEELKQITTALQTEKHPKDQIKNVKAQIAEIESGAATDEAAYKNIEVRVKELEAIRDSGQPFSPEHQQQLENFNAQLTSLMQKRENDIVAIKQLKSTLASVSDNISRTDNPYYKNERRKEYLEDSITEMEGYIKKAKQYEAALASYKRSEKRYTSMLDTINKELVVYKTISKLLQDSKSLNAEDLRKRLQMVNLLAKEREKLFLPKGEEAESYIVHEEGAAPEELVSEESLLKIQKQFNEQLNKTKLSDASVKMQEAKNQLNEIIKNQYDSIKDSYITHRQLLTNSIQDLKKHITQSPKFNLAEASKDINKNVNVYEQRKNTVDKFRKNLGELYKKSPNALTTEAVLKSAPPTGKDDVVIKAQTVIADALNRLTLFTNEVMQNKEALAELKTVGITPELLKDTIKEITQIGAHSEDNPYGVNNLSQVIDGLKQFGQTGAKSLPVRGKDFLPVLSNSMASIKDLSDINLKRSLEASELFSDAISNTIHSKFFNPSELVTLFNDAKNVSGLKELIGSQSIVDYMKDSRELAKLRDESGREFIKKHIETALAGFLKVLKNINEGADSDGKKYDKIEKLLDNLQGGTEIEQLVNNIVRPQTKELIKVISDRRYGKHYEFEESRTFEQVAKNIKDYYVGTTTSKISSQNVAEQNRNWYTNLRLWVTLVEQCKRSIVRSQNAEDLSYTSQPTHYSPRYKAMGVGPVRSEIADLTKQNKENPDPAIQKQIDQLQNYLVKLPLSDKALIQAEIKNLRAQKPVNENAILYLEDLHRRIDTDNITKREEALLKNLKATPEERDLIKRLNKKWGTGVSTKGVTEQKQQKAIENQIGKINENITKLKTDLANYAFPDDTLKEYITASEDKKTPEYKKSMQLHIKALKKTPEYQNYLKTPEYAKYREISEKINEVSDIEEELWLPLFKVKYAPNLLSKEEKQQLGDISKEFDKELSTEFGKQLSQQEMKPEQKKKIIEKTEAQESEIGNLVYQFLEQLAAYHGLVDENKKIKTPEALSKEQLSELNWLLDLTDTYANMQKSRALYQKVKDAEREIDTINMGYGSKDRLPELQKNLTRDIAELEDVGKNPTALLRSMFRKVYEYPVENLKNKQLEETFIPLKEMIAKQLGIGA
jgi:hypothetical protein